MLVSNLKKALFKPARPARRRFHVGTINLQDLEPRLFLSVNSLVSTDVSADQETETPATDIESSSVDSTIVDATVDPSAEMETSGSGVSSGVTSWAANPSFANVYMDSNEFGVFVAGTVEWEDYPFGISGIRIEFHSLGENPELIGMAYTDDYGDFILPNVSEYVLTAILFNPNTDTACDSVGVSY